MATGGIDPSSIKGGHDIVPDWPCDKCEESDTFTEAIAYCRHCDEKLCKVCLTYHDRYTKGHKVIDQEGKDDWGKPIMSLGIGVECPEHEGQDISLYCGKHDNVCCPVCAVQQHSDRCRPKMLYIRKAAQGITANPDYHRFLANNDQLISRIAQTEDKKSELLSIVAESRKSCKADAKTIGKRMSQHIKRCTDRSLAEIDKIHDDVERKLAEDIANCAAMKQELNEIKADVQTKPSLNEASIFVTLKTKKSKFEKYDSSLRLLNESKCSTFSFHQSPDIQQLIRLETLGECTGQISPKEDGQFPRKKSLVAVEDTGEKESCIICMDDTTDPQTIPCGHSFCSDCLKQLSIYRPVCPTCFKPFGIIKGDQPDGTMRDFVEPYKICTGYESCGLITIQYRFPSGLQKENHPVPGTRYAGIQRNAYLPDNRQGNIVLEILKVAWNRKLVFTIGASRTTGQEGVITWNDIHHKTNMTPHGKFGYPDPDYLQRVTEELAVKNVTEKDIPEDRWREINRRFPNRL